MWVRVLHFLISSKSGVAVCIYCTAYDTSNTVHRRASILFVRTTIASQPQGGSSEDSYVRKIRSENNLGGGIIKYIWETPRCRVSLSYICNQLPNLTWLRQKLTQVSEADDSIRELLTSLQSQVRIASKFSIRLPKVTKEGVTGGRPENEQRHIWELVRDIARYSRTKKSKWRNLPEKVSKCSTMAALGCVSQLHLLDLSQSWRLEASRPQD